MLQCSRINSHQGAVMQTQDGPPYKHYNTFWCHPHYYNLKGVCISVTLAVTLMDVFQCESVVLSDRYICTVQSGTNQDWSMVSMVIPSIRPPTEATRLSATTLLRTWGWGHILATILHSSTSTTWENIKKIYIFSSNLKFDFEGNIPDRYSNEK